MSYGKFLVIGSNCFTGSHIADALLDDPEAEVVGVSRSPEYHDVFLPYRRRPAGRFRFHQINFVSDLDRLTQLLDEVKPQVVVNVAALSEVALSNERPVEYFETNTLAVVKLCNRLRTRRYLERYVHISSAEVYGSCHRPLTEDAPFNPSTPYAASKAAADFYVNTLIKNFDFPATLIRSTNVYGRHQQLFKIIPRTAIYLKLGHTIELHGGGHAVKSFVHVRDVSRGVLLALSRGRPGTYHFTIPAEQTVAEVVRYVCSALGYDFEQATRKVGERLGQDARYLLDCSKAGRELGWEPQVTFEDGVREVIDWVDGNWSLIRELPLVYVHKV